MKKFNIKSRTFGKVILVAFIALFNILGLFGQETRKIILDFKPYARGYEVSVAVLYKFINVYGEVQISANLEGPVTATKYLYNGKTYNSIDIIGKVQFPNVNKSLSLFSVEADLYNGNTFLGKITLYNMIFGAGIADTYNLFKQIGMDGKDYKDKINSLSLQNLKLSISSCSDLELEQLIINKEKGSPANTQNFDTNTNKTTSSITTSSNKSLSKTSSNNIIYNEAASGTVKGEALNVNESSNSSSYKSYSQNQNAEQQRIRDEQAMQNAQAKSQAERNRQVLLDEIARREQQNKQMEQNLNQAASDISYMVAGIIASNQASKDAERERLELEKLRKEEEQLREKEEQRIVLENKRIENERVAKLTNFYENSIPLFNKPSPYQDPSVKEVFIIYIIRTDLNILYFSNPFVIKRQSDGTWPFVSDINTKLKNETKANDFKLVGFFSDIDIALSKVEELVQNSLDAGFEVNEFRFGYKVYYVNEQKPEEQPAQKKTTVSDFWNK